MRKAYLYRHVKISDAEQMVPLFEQLGYPVHLEDLRKRLLAFISLDGYGVVVACYENNIVGFVAWSRSKLFVLDKVRVHVEAIVVDKNYRGYGVGKKLLECVEQFAFQLRPVVIDLTSGKRRAKNGSHDFYKGLGYKNEGDMAKLYFKKELD